ncbi:MAG: hypothetical protein ACYYKD_13310 [Rhodospirillales bacterium]
MARKKLNGSVDNLASALRLALEEAVENGNDEIRAEMEDMRVELRGEMRKMEARLNKKIVGVNKQAAKTVSVMLKKQREGIVADIKQALSQR